MNILDTRHAQIKSDRQRRAMPVRVTLIEVQALTLFGFDSKWCAIYDGERCCPDAAPEMLHETQAQARSHGQSLVNRGEWKP